MALNEQLVKEFIEKQKATGKSKAQIRKLYENAKASGTFNQKERVKPFSVEGFYEYGLKPSAKRLKETFTQDLPEVGQEIKQSIYDMGGDVRKIQTGRQQEVKSLAGKAYNIFDRTSSDMIESVKATDISKGGIAETTYQVGGLFAKAVVDLFGESTMSALKTVAPKDLEEDTKELILKGLQTVPGQKIMELSKEYEQNMAFLKENDPRAYRNYKATFGYLEGLGEVLGVTKAKEAATGIKEGAASLTEKGIKLKDAAMEATGTFVTGAKDTTKSQKELLLEKLQGVKASDKLTQDLPEAIVRRDLGFTPKERGQIEDILGKTEAQYSLEKGVADKPKEDQAAFFANNANTQFNEISKKLEAIETKVESPRAIQAIEDMLEQLNSSKKIQDAYAEDIALLNQLLLQKLYTGAELNNIRRAFDKINTGMYTVGGKVRSGLENQIDVDIRKELNNQIEEIAETAGFSVKEMNAELRASLVMKDALLRRLSQEQKNNFLGLQDLGVSAILSGGNPIQAVGMIGAKKGLEGLAPTAAQKIYKVRPKTDAKTKSTRRGNTITGSNKSSRLGLTRSTGDNVPSKSTKDGETKSKDTKPKKKPLIKKKSTAKKPTSKKTTKKAISNKRASVDITALESIADGIIKLGKKITPMQIDRAAKQMVAKLDIAKKNIPVAVKIVKDYIKKYGEKLKDKLGDMLDDIADKTGARLKFIDDSGKDFSKAGTTESALVKETKKYKSADEVTFGKTNLPYGLTRNEIDEISKYTNWGYKGTSNTKKIDSILEKLPNYDGFVFRKDNINIKDFVTGQDFSFGKPLSTTNKVDILDNFKGNTEFTIKSSLGKDISQFSDLPAEGEILFNSSAKFKIESIRKSSDGVNMIELKQIK